MKIPNLKIVSRLLALVGLQIILFAFFSLLFSNLSFLLNQPIGFLISPVSLILSIVTIWFMNKKFFYDKWKLIAFLIIIAGILSTCLYISYKIYDTTWDGIEYHQETVLALINHDWKPLMQPLSPQSTDPGLTIWVEHYAKGVEIISATLYAVFNKIESAKAFNLLFILSSFFLSFDILYRKLKLSLLRSSLLSFVSAFNPVSVCQMFTFCVDGVMASLILIFVCLSFYLITTRNNKYIIPIVGILCLLINIKLTAVVYAVIGCLAIILFLIIKKFSYKSIRKITLIMIITGVVGVGFLGFNPYIYNTINHGSPFYPLVGENSVDIMTPNTPPEIKNLSKIEQMIFTDFEFTKDSMNHTIRRYPLFNIQFRTGSDLRIGGFGPLFMEITLIAVLGALVIFTSKEKFSSKLIFALIEGIILISVMIIPESWWARYVPQLYLIPIICSITILISKKIPQFFGELLILFLVINTIYVAYPNLKYAIDNNKIITATVNEIKNMNKTIVIYKGMRFGNNKLRFIEKDIPYDIIEDKNQYDAIPNPIGMFPVTPYEIKIKPD